MTFIGIEDSTLRQRKKISICKACQEKTKQELVVVEKRVVFFFFPLFTFDRKQYTLCNSCGAFVDSEGKIVRVELGKVKPQDFFNKISTPFIALMVLLAALPTMIDVVLKVLAGDVFLSIFLPMMAFFAILVIFVVISTS